MKQFTIKSKIVCAIVALIIIIGAIVVYVKGFAIDLQYQANQTIELYLEDEFDMADIKEITDEVFEGEKVILKKVEVYEDTVAITVAEITDEQKSAVVEKINEKYGLELEADDISIESEPNTRLRDILSPYVLPIIIATSIILLYMIIMYRKLGVIKVIVETGLIALVAELTLFGIMAITRFPIGRYTIPLMLFVYIASMFGITSKFEKKLTSLKEKETDENQE